MEISKKVKEAKYYENSNYCGTEQYHKVGLGIVATDGGKHVFEHLKCFWIADVISSYVPKMNKNDNNFWVARIIVEDSKADFYIEDGDYVVYIHQEIPFTDLKKNVKLYVQKSEIGYVVFLPSEY